jgi:SAM-dependent methyltransferase
VASQAERARSFGAIAEDYDRLRPAPPDEALSWLLPACCETVVDLAAGTGLVSRALLAHAGVGRVVAIEPDPQMAAVLHARSDGLTVLRGVGEAIPLAAASADAVLISSAWHWLDPERAIPELARVLREGGRLCVLRTGLDQESGWLRELRRERSGRDRQLRDMSGRYETLPTTGQFGNAARASFTFTRAMTADDFVGLLATYSEVLTASEQDRATDLGLVRSELNRLFPGGGDIEVPMRTRCWRADRVALAVTTSTSLSGPRGDSDQRVQPAGD